MFSCCCAWNQVCQCLNATENSCSSSCVNTATKATPLSYYHLALSIYRRAQEIYSKARHIWLVGHSLGGSIASLVALTTKQTAIAFQAPGDRLYAKRLGLPYEEHKFYPIYHIGNTIDPIFMGKCNGKVSYCYYAGYRYMLFANTTKSAYFPFFVSMDTKCHMGQVCKWDHWQPSRFPLYFHSMSNVIKDFIEPFGMPKCRKEIDCVDCEQYRFTP